MSATRSLTLGGGATRSGQATPGSFRNSSARSSGSSGSEHRGKTQRGGPGNGVRLSARDIMHGKTAPDGKAQAQPQDDYPGLEAILKKARKMKPFLDTDLEQAHRALDSMLPLGTFQRMREILHGRMEQDLVKAIAKWRADNWLLPVDKESEFPYARTRNLFDPMERYGNLWLRKYYDCGFKYDGEGEDLSFPEYMENCARANAVEMIDLAIKGVEQWWKPDVALLEKMKVENVSLKKEYANTEFDRHEEVLKTYMSDGYMISGRFRAFKLYSKEQQKLLEAFEAKPTAETKKELLQHVYKHGQLVRDVPKEDSHKKKVEEQKPVAKKASVQVGSVMDSVDA